jgi:hypothetical protein
VTTRSSVAFLISDFYAKDLKKSLVLANKRHDLIAVRISDPRDSELPEAGIVSLRDAESGRRYSVNTSRASVRKRYRESASSGARELKALFASAGMDSIDISTAAPYVDPLIKFFAKRRMRKAPGG